MLPKSLEKLINELSKLPGIGPKSAQRLALYLMKKDSFEIKQLSEAISQVREGVVFCEICHSMADTSPCAVCQDTRRDHGIICVVEEAQDAQALEKTGAYNGVFHILGGVLNPMEGIGPEKLNIQSLLKRLETASPKINEIILATNPTLEGETTALHLTKILKNFDVLVSRIARGIPMGGDLEYADDVTLSRALEGRKIY